MKVFVVIDAPCGRLGSVLLSAVLLFASLCCAPLAVAQAPARPLSAEATRAHAKPARAKPAQRQAGLGSWYGAELHGRKTASGERFDMEQLTAAHPSWPLSTWVRVTHRRTGKSVVVRINDRGPFGRGRIIDLSHAAALRLGVTGHGAFPVVIERLAGKPAEAEDGDVHEERDDHDEHEVRNAVSVHLPASFASTPPVPGIE